MKKKEIISFVAIAAFVIGVLGFVLDFSGVSSAVCSWVAAVFFIASNLATAAALWLRKHHSRFLLDDVPVIAAYVAAFGVALGMLVLIVEACTPISSRMLDFMRFPTIGMVSLGLLVLGLFFAFHCCDAVVRKNFWTIVQGVCTSGLMIAVAVAISCVAGLLPQAWLGLCAYLIIVCIILVLMAIIMSEYQDKKTAKSLQR